MSGLATTPGGAALNPDMLSAVAAAMSEAPVEETKSEVDRENAPPEQPGREEAVTKLISNIKADKARWKKQYDRMRFDMKLVAGKNMWPDQKEKDTRYIANLLQRHIRSRVSKTYAKNPTVVAKRKERVKFTTWDGNQNAYQLAEQMHAAAQQGQMMPNQVAEMIVADVDNAALTDDMLDKIGKTAQIICTYFMKQQRPAFKIGMKRMVRRSKTVGIGYVRMGYKRAMDVDAREAQPLPDSQRIIEKAAQIKADLDDKVINDDDPQVSELNDMTDLITAKGEVVLREGLIWDWPHPLRVIPDRNCTQLDGWIGADRVSIEHVMTPARIQQVFKKDIKASYTAYRANLDGKLVVNREMQPATDMDTGDDSLALVWETYVRSTGLKYFTCDGHKDFLQDPEEPEFLERFFPIYSYAPNELDEEDDIFPPSDAKLMEHIQKDYNRVRESKRQHRIANRPLYLAQQGIFEGDDKIKTLAAHPAHAIVEVPAVPGVSPDNMVSAMKKVGIDPEVYNTNDHFEDILRVVGSQEADLGGTSGSTATEASIDNSANMTSVEDDIDLLDGLLSEMFTDAGNILFTEISTEKAVKIAGPGAVWPELSSKQDVVDEMFLDIEAGSSGRPNQAQKIANLERLTPLLTQIPGIMNWLAKVTVQAVDPTVDLTEAITAGLPSIVQLTGAQQPSTGDPATDPNAQGPAGAQNAPAAPGAPIGGQATMPAPAPPAG